MQARDSGLFSSSLVPQPTTDQTPLVENQKEWARVVGGDDMDKRARAAAYRVPPANDVEVAFRHGDWLDDRDAVRAALGACGCPPARLERFDGCGSACSVDVNTETGKYRVRANYCGDRFCRPCSRARSKRVQAQMMEWTQGQTLRFITLTLARSDQSLQSILNHLLKSFYRLRRQGFWKSAVRAGTAVVEITRGKGGDHWHVHLHVLTVGTWLDQKTLSAGWELATGGSKIVDIRLVKDHEVGVAYVAKYATKGWSDDVLKDHDALIECIVSLRGRRLLIHFGEWYGRESPLCQVEVGEWKHVGWLRRIVADAIDREPNAVGVLAAIGYVVGWSEGRPVFLGANPPWCDVGRPGCSAADLANRGSTARYMMG